MKVKYWTLLHFERCLTSKVDNFFPDITLVTRLNLSSWWHSLGWSFNWSVSTRRNCFVHKSAPALWARNYNEETADSAFVIRINGEQQYWDHLLKYIVKILEQWGLHFNRNVEILDPFILVIRMDCRSCLRSQTSTYLKDMSKPLNEIFFNLIEASIENLHLFSPRSFLSSPLWGLQNMYHREGSLSAAWATEPSDI